MTDISVTTTTFTADDRSWVVGTHGHDSTPTVTLDVSAFTEAAHYPNGYIPSGVAVGKITASGLYGPYLDSASDGTEVAAGYLAYAVKVGANAADVAGALFIHGVVDESRLPLDNSTTEGGFIDANGKGDLNLIAHV